MPKWKRWLVLAFLTLLVVPPILFAAWSWAALTYVYASGERAGFVQKFSRKGWLFKTWEGELAMVNLPGAMPEIFHFTVRREDIAHNVERMVGQRASLSYEQHKGLPGDIFGDTEYYVVRIATAPSPS